MRVNKFRQINQNLSRGEVFTPPQLVVKILSKIPENVYLNKESMFLIPGCGMGVFMIELVRILVEKYGYSVEDAKSRVIGIDNRIKYINFLKRKGYRVYHLDFLKDELPMREFDVIIGNPPYQESVSHGKKVTGNGALWVKFTIKSLELAKKDGYVGLVIPDSWTAPTYDLMGSRESIFNDYFKKYNLTYVNFDVKKYFNGVGITPSVFLLKKSDDYTFTEVETSDNKINLNLSQMKFIPKDTNAISLSIHNKILTNIENSNTIKMRWSSDVLNIKTSDIQNDIFKYKVIDHHTYKPIRYGNLEDKDYNRIKLLFPYVGKYQVIKDDGVYGAKPQVSILFLNTKTELQSAYSFYSSKLITFVMDSNKWTQYLLTQILNFIKTPSFDVVYTESDLYELFNLTQEEINYIENYVG